MRRFSQRNSLVTLNEINITPLTDIFLVLLIIMMVVAPMLDTQGLKLSVPSGGPAPDVKEEPKTVNLTINAGGSYAIDDKPVEESLLSLSIREQAKTKTDGVIIRTHPDASHEAMTKAMDAAQSAGIDKIAVMENQS